MLLSAPISSGNAAGMAVFQSLKPGTHIILPDDNAQIISTNEHPYLKQKTGEDIITASGTTLLGADDKAGIAEKAGQPMLPGRLAIDLANQ